MNKNKFLGTVRNGDTLVIKKNIVGRIDELDQKHYEDDFMNDRLSNARAEDYAGQKVTAFCGIDSDNEINVIMPNGADVYLPAFALRRVRKTDKF